jgi:transcriptional antiterminator RfaH
MPILPAEPDVYPPGLFEGTATMGERAWWVLHTKPRQEKALARQMYQAGVPFYLPLLQRKNLIRGRLMQSCVPLFTSYLFLLADGAERILALATRRVVKSLQVRQQQQLWEDLTQVNRLIHSGMPVTPEQQLFPGASVVIRSGLLAGLKGKILRSANRRRFVVLVDFIQQGASVVIEDYMLDAIKE